jgi:hypothetical protein
MEYVSTETMASAAGYVSREFGYGYGIRVVSAGFYNALFELHAGDGSRRLFVADRYGNIELGPVDMDAGDDYAEWCRNAADALYHKRNGYAVELYSA